MHTQVALPPLPVVGMPEQYYRTLIERAAHDGDCHRREAAKVAHYISSALAPNVPWDEKRRFFRHAIRHHCNPPEVASVEVYHFYDALQDLVQKHAGEEAMRLASQEDDRLDQRVRQGENRDDLRHVANTMFRAMFGDENKKPEYFSEDDWHQIQVLRGGWK